MERFLEEQIMSRIEQSRQKLSPEMEATFRRAIEELSLSNQAKGLKHGDIAPDFVLEDANGQLINLYDLLAKGPVVLTFYRGDWCPYCNLQLKAYKSILPQITTLGANLIAISPQEPDLSLKLNNKLDLSFPILSDKGLKVADSYSIVYDLPGYLQIAYKSLGIDLEVSNADHLWRLPQAATFIINKHGLICYAFVESDYKRRMEPIDIISILELLVTGDTHD